MDLPDSLDSTRPLRKPQGSVLLLGGTGEAGRRIAAFLAPRISGRITIAGRNREKADYWCRRLRETAAAVVSLDAASADVGDPDSVAESLRGHDMAVLSAPLGVATMDRFIDAVTAAGVDCVELSSVPGKRALFERRSDDVRESRSRFILDAGADPGAPGWAARHVLGQLELPRTIEVYARYRDANLGDAGAADLLTEVSEDPMVYRRGWRKAGLLDWRLPAFPAGLGRSLSMPLSLPQLMALPREYDLDRLGHGDVYEATAAVAGLAVLHLATTERGGGRWDFVGEWLDDPLTPERLRSAGFSLDCD